MQYLEHHGCRLAYRLRGSGPPVVFIQGSGAHGDAWNPQIDSLQSQFTCLSFDNRGMGPSQPLPASLTVEQMADDTLALMDHVGWSDAHIVGHSLGGLIAQCLALRAPERVRSLSLLCTFSDGKDATRMSAGMFWTGLRTFIGTRRMRRRAFCEFVLPPSLWGDKDHWAELLKPLFGHDLADQPPVVMKQLKAMKAYDATPRLAELQDIPTLIVGARFDRIATPPVIERLVQSYPNCQFTNFEQAAHGVPIQCADEVNQLLAKHFLRAGARASRPHFREGGRPRPLP